MLVFNGRDSAAAFGKLYQAGDSMYYPIVVPVVDQNELLGYLVRWRIVAATPQSIERFSQLLGTRAALYFGNMDGSLWTDMMKPVAAPIPGETDPSDNIYKYFRNGDGRLIASSKPIPGTPWMIVVEFAQQKVLETSNLYLRRVLFIGVGLLVVGVIITWLMSRNITRPLNYLTAGASAIAAGNHSPAVHVDHGIGNREDEIGKLSRAFNAMLDKVNEARRDLEQKMIETSEVNERLRELSGHLQNVREEERIHIAREMHDELGQLLTSFKMDVSWLQKKLLDHHDPAVKEKINGMISVIDESVKFVRRLAAELRPGILDDLGLVAALEWQSGEFAKRYNIPVEFSSPVQQLNTTSSVATGLFRMYQESLTNVARHSGADKVVTTLQINRDKLRLSIADNGRGFEPERSARKTLGLLGMKERANMIGGNLEIDSRPGKGTTVVINVPLQEMAV
jgi:signal transduction histidine kinase